VGSRGQKHRGRRTPENARPQQSHVVGNRPRRKHAVKKNMSLRSQGGKGGRFVQGMRHISEELKGNEPKNGQVGGGGGRGGLRATKVGVRTKE